MNTEIELEGMTHEGLVVWARHKSGTAATENLREALAEAASELQDAVDNERESNALASRIMNLIREA